jgi:hypothetical protein
MFLPNFRDALARKSLCTADDGGPEATMNKRDFPVDKATNKNIR